MAHAREEVEGAFAHWWQVGNVLENWRAWGELFTPDVSYVDHFWGPLRGRQAVVRWCEAVMAGVPEIYTVYDWHVVDGDRVVFHCENRRDNPSSEGPDYWDFPGLSVLTYAGDGLWSSEEDFWDLSGARRTAAEYHAACEAAGNPDRRQRMTRRHWPTGPDWARTDELPAPSWLDQSDVRPVVRPSELRALMASL